MPPNVSKFHDYAILKMELCFESFDICYSGPDKGTDWHGKRLWLGAQHHLPPWRWAHNENFPHLTFLPSLISISFLNLQLKWTGPREVVLREGCAWVVLGRWPIFNFATCKTPSCIKLMTAWSFRVDEVSIQFAEFRSNPLYVKVGKNGNSGKSSRYEKPRLVESTYGICLISNCLYFKNPTQPKPPRYMLCGCIFCSTPFFHLLLCSTSTLPSIKGLFRYF